MGFRNIVLPNGESANPIEAEATNQIPERGYFSTIEFGAGSKTFKGDERGIWMGSSDFETAPFRVDMEGNVYISSPDQSGGYIRINAELNQIYLHDGTTGRILKGKSCPTCGQEIGG